MSAGVFGYLGYDMVRQMEELGPPKPDPLGFPDARPDPPDHDRRLRRGQGRDHHRLAGPAGARPSPPTAYAPRAASA